MMLISALVLGGSAWMINAEQDGSAPPRGQRPPPFPPPIIVALDVNKDRVIDFTEIANAPTALKALDKNGDGQLTADEYQPQFCPPPPPEGEDGTNTIRRPPPPPPDASSSPSAGGPPPPPPDPITSALDANHDGVIDAAEIANAPTALKALDKNGDGQLTPDECRPQFKGGPPPDSTTTF